MNWIVMLLLGRGEEWKWNRNSQEKQNVCFIYCKIAWNFISRVLYIAKLQALFFFKKKITWSFVLETSSLFIEELVNNPNATWLNLLNFLIVTASVMSFVVFSFALSAFPYKFEEPINLFERWNSGPLLGLGLRLRRILIELIVYMIKFCC